MTDKSANYFAIRNNAVKETAKVIFDAVIRISDTCTTKYEFQNKLMDYAEYVFELEIEHSEIIGEKKKC